MCKKNFIPISIGFCVIALQSYREILKKYRKRAITLPKKQFFKNLRKAFLGSPVRRVLPKFQSCTLNGVATIEITYILTDKKRQINWHNFKIWAYHFSWQYLKGDVSKQCLKIFIFFAESFCFSYIFLIYFSVYSKDNYGKTSRVKTLFLSDIDWLFNVENGQNIFWNKWPKFYLCQFACQIACL